jgi:hypothetical protein
VPPDELGRAPGDLGAILGVLVAHEIEFLLIGGLAVIAHGHTRTTGDVDIIPAPRTENWSRLAAALSELKASAFDDRGRRLPLDLSHPESLAIGNYFLVTRAGGLDIVNGPRPDLKRWLALAGRALQITVAGASVNVIGLDDLIRMKRETGRDKDLRDIAALTEVERRSREA